MLNSSDLPERLPARDLVLLIESSELWRIGMACLCGCKQQIDLPLIKEVRPRWEVSVHKNVGQLFFLRSG
ncbi:DUF6527 family protein [Janthinobacterium sp. RT4P48]|uniref:DUF6527 family protein n=1 Tax=Janthinobacterium sp. RT4P48 TaxID=3424188 RepID=UPI003F26C705